MLELLHPANVIEAIRGFLDAGGIVVVVLLFSSLLLWLLICERFFYFIFTEPRFRRTQQERWEAVRRQSSWEVYAFRERLISEIRIDNEQFLRVIRALIVVTPLLGLLGTVTGMIEVFQVITDVGSSNARLMAAGISKATLPTMTGLAVSLTGILAIGYLERLSDNSTMNLSESLEVEAGMGYGSIRRLTDTELGDGEVDITPLLDIVFILLIFFIVTSTFLDEEGIEIATPEDTPPEELTRPPPTMVLAVRADGFVMVDQVRMIDPRSVKPVVEAFMAERPNGVVLLNAAPEAPVSATVLVLDQTRQAGVDPALAIQSDG